MTTTGIKSKCACGTPIEEMPMFFVARSHYDSDGNDIGEEDHMFPGCRTCGETFCSCGNPHRLKAAPPENVVDATGHDTWAEHRGER